jgi:hypothetical protein
MRGSRSKNPPVRLRRTAGARRFEWTEELLRCLGVLPDAAVATKAGIGPRAVAAERRRRGIPPARPRRPPIEWTEDMLALLGTDSDAAVARELGVHKESVGYKRHQLGIPAFHPPRHDNCRKFSWQPEDLALLGKVSDGELARTLGLATASVNRKRQQLGIPPFQPAPRPIEWTSGMIERLGRASDARVAKELGISIDSVKGKRQALGIPATLENLPVERSEEVAALLRLPDTEVSHRTGLDWSTIQRLRGELGVREKLLSPPGALPVPDPETSGPTARERAPGSMGPAGPEPAWRAQYRWRPEEIALLGSAPDEEIAAWLGRTVNAVRTRRQMLRILHRPNQAWQPHEIELLGTAPDVQIATRLGRSEWSVNSKRRKLGIPRIPRVDPRRWTAAEEALLGTAPDAEIARRIGRSAKAVAKRRRRVRRRD